MISPDPAGIKVLSLFDGMACGLQALKQANISVKSYHAYEIDSYAIQIAQKNHPEIIQCGSVVGADFTKHKGADLVIAGSPCQGFSFAGKGLAFDDSRSALFFEFVRALKEVQPKYFLLENVRTKKEHMDVISDMLGVQPINICSSLVSAQKRNRYYWCNWDVEPPADLGILLKDIIEKGAVDRDKSLCIDANYFKGGNLKQYFEKHRRQLVFVKKGDVVKVSERGRRLTPDGVKRDDKCGQVARGYELCLSQKTGALTTVLKDNYILKDYIVRKLTPVECERLQTLPDNYTQGVSNTQRYKMLGNGWTVKVAQGLFEQMPI